MLNGSSHINKGKDLSESSKSNLVRACGYAPNKKDSIERLNFSAFYEALLEAIGVRLGVGNVGGIGKHGCKLSYVASVQGNDNLLIGEAHTALLDLEP